MSAWKKGYCVSSSPLETPARQPVQAWEDVAGPGALGMFRG